MHTAACCRRSARKEADGPHAEFASVCQDFAALATTIRRGTELAKAARGEVQVDPVADISDRACMHPVSPLCLAVLQDSTTRGAS